MQELQCFYSFSCGAINQINHIYENFVNMVDLLFAIGYTTCKSILIRRETVCY